MANQITVMIVDEDAGCNLFNSNQLIESGYHVMIAETGKEALSLLRDHQVDIMLVDPQLFDMSAEDLHFQALVIDPKLKVVFFGANMAVDQDTLVPRSSPEHLAGVVGFLVS